MFGVPPSGGISIDRQRLRKRGTPNKAPPSLRSYGSLQIRARSVTADCFLLTADGLPSRHAGSAQVDCLSRELFLPGRHRIAAARRRHSRARVLAPGPRLLFGQESKRATDTGLAADPADASLRQQSGG